jgi:hypothetical protein
MITAPSSSAVRMAMRITGMPHPDGGPLSSQPGTDTEPLADVGGQSGIGDVYVTSTDFVPVVL